MAGRYSLYIFTIFLLALTQAIYHLPQSVIDYMATRQMRYQHLLWHNVRNSWDTLDSSTKRALTALGWDCPHPSQTARGDPLENNLSGEDFFYMHRQMIRQAKAIAQADPTPPLPGENPLLLFSSWSVIPASGSADYPVPPVYDSGNADTNALINKWKTDEIYTYIQSKETQFKDPNYLRSVTLGQLGSRIEFTLHNGLHVRWSDDTTGLRRRPANPVPQIDLQWDNGSYVWLIDSYASHVNPYFYKIHAWIDARVEDWRKANGLSEITWQGTWTGGPTSSSDVTSLVQVGKDHHLRVEGAEIPAPGSSNMDDMGHMNMGDGSMDILDQVFEILQKAGVNSDLYNMVRCSENEELVKDD